MDYSREDLSKEIQSLNTNIESLVESIKKLRLGDYIESLNHPFKIFYYNFVWGLSRGIGMAIGFTLLGALVVYVLKSMVSLNLPWIGNYIADIVKIVQDNLK